MEEYRCVVCGTKISEEDFKRQHQKCEICMIRANPILQLITGIIISGVITYLLTKDGTENQGIFLKSEKTELFLFWLDVSVGWLFLSGFGLSITRLLSQEVNNSDDSLMILGLIIVIFLVSLKIFASAFIGIIALPANIIRIVFIDF